MAGARRNSPRIDQLGDHASRYARAVIGKAPALPRQAEMGGMETDAAAIVLVAEKRRRDAKEYKSPIKKGENDFEFACRSFCLPMFARQWEMPKFVQEPRNDGRLDPRVWRFDFCFINFKLIVEIQGGVWRPGGGAHSHPIDITRNMTKQNDAVLAGYQVLQFTPDDVARGEAIAFTQRVLYARGWTGAQ